MVGVGTFGFLVGVAGDWDGWGLRRFGLFGGRVERKARVGGHAVMERFLSLIVGRCSDHGLDDGYLKSCTWMFVCTM